MEKFWTDAKIAGAIEKYKDRKVKPAHKRRPTKFETVESLSKLVSERNGFHKDHVREVLDDFVKIIHEQIMLGKKVQLKDLGSLYLKVSRPHKTNVNLKGLGEGLSQLYVAPRFTLEFYRSESANWFFKSREVSEEELEAIFEEE